MKTCKDCIHENVCVIRGFPSAFENTWWEKEPCDHFKSKSEWISVDERLPENDTERVLVHLSDCSFTKPIGFNKLDTDRYVDGKWVRWSKYVTHWMPLPEPPQMKGGE